MGGTFSGTKKILLASVLSCGFLAFTAHGQLAEASGLHNQYSPSHTEVMFAVPHQYMDTVSVSGSQIGEGAENFVNSMASRALEFLGNNGMNQTQRKEEFRKLLNDSFDMSTIGRFTLGRYWRTSTKDQRDEYLTLFKKMVINVYSERFGEYQGQDFETRGHRFDGEKDTIVTSYIVPESGPEIQVDWRVRYKDGRYSVIDVIVEGVSMSVTQRSDFAAVIQRGGGDVQVLLAHLRNAQ